MNVLTRPDKVLTYRKMENHCKAQMPEKAEIVTKVFVTIEPPGIAPSA
jgi:hypothetical protein